MDVKQAEKLYKWMFSFRNPSKLIEDHVSYLGLEIVLYICFLLSLKHALRHGGRHISLFLGITLHGFVLETLSFHLQDVDNFWHAQSSIMLWGKRLPLHIVCFYPTIFYTAIVSVSRVKNLRCSQMFAAAFASLVLTFPLDILGVKLLWWTFHDTDPNLKDRLYFAPWITLCFSAVFASSLSFVLYFMRRLVAGDSGDKSKSCNCCKELLCAILVAVLAVPIEMLQYMFLYHVPHDVLGIPSSVCVTSYLVLIAFLSWIGDRYKESKDDIRAKPDELLLLVITYFTFLISTVILSKPENIFSVGLHQPIGNCNENETIHTSLGMAFNRSKFLCASNYDEAYFDFHCAIQPTMKWENQKEYIICGTPFSNHNEYIAIITSAALFGIYFYYQILVKKVRHVSKSNPKLKIN